MKINYYSPVSKSSFRLFLLSLFAFVLFSGHISAQTFKTHVRYIEPAPTNLTAGLQFSNIQKSEFDALVSKITDLQLYTLTNEFYAEKNMGTVSLRSNSPAQVKDFESLLKQIGIATVEYNSKIIPTTQLESNYTPVNKTEVKPIERRK